VVCSSVRMKGKSIIPALGKKIIAAANFATSWENRPRRSEQHETVTEFLWNSFRALEAPSFPGWRPREFTVCSEIDNAPHFLIAEACGNHLKHFALTRVTPPASSR